MQTTKITNSNSAYFNQACKVIKYLPEEKVEVFLIDEEILLCLPMGDIAQKEKTYSPKSRKDFYCFIKDPKTSRVDIKNSLEEMIKHKKIIPKNADSSAICSFFDSDMDKEELVEEFRKLRDTGGFEFSLENNHTPHHSAPKKHFNKKPRYA